jgi:membrane protein implicated in regulation of membrane protease activity
MTIGELTLDAHWWWMIIAVVLGVLELILPGVFLIWLSAAAAITGLVALFFGPPVALQFIIFAALALATTYAGRRWYLAHPVPSSDPMLNERSAQMVGQIVTVAQPITGGSGRVRVGDGEWPATGPDAPVGARMRVTAVDRGTLVVEPA